MKKQKVTGFTIQIIPTHIGAEGYELCGTCKTKIALVYPTSAWTMDSEPFKNNETVAEEVLEEVDVGEVTGHWCKECQILVSLSYNF